MRTIKISALAALSIFTILAVSSAPAVGREKLSDVPSAVTSITTRDLELRTSVIEQIPFDTVVLNTGKKFVSGSRPNVVPRGWSCEPQAGAWNCSGSPQEHAHFSFRHDAGISIPKRVNLDVRSGKKRVGKYDISPENLERIPVIRDFESVIRLVPDVKPGDLFMVQPVDGAAGGDWKFHAGDSSFDPVDDFKLKAEYRIDETLLRDRLFFFMPETATKDLEYRITWDDPFGDRWVDAPAPNYFYSEPREEPCTPGMIACQARAVTGGTVCVCGCFPAGSWIDLQIDGKPASFPTAASSGILKIPVEDLAPGRHHISWPEMGHSMPFEVVAIRGSIDQSRLKVGQSTGLHFGLQGTEAVLPMRVQLLGGNVRIAGGNDQVAYTSGGPDNKFSRILEARGLGEFDISYSFEASLCPCSSDEGTGLLDESWATHPLSEAEGRFDLDFNAGVDKTFPMTFRSDSIVTHTPWPPFKIDQGLEIDFVQLGLNARTPGFGRFTFEEKTDLRSFGLFRKLTLTDEGGFRSGEGELEFHTEFSTAWDKNLPLKLGATYDVGIRNFELRGVSPGVGDVTMRQLDGTESTARIENLRKDKAGKTLFGDATFRIHAEAKISF